MLARRSACVIGRTLPLRPSGTGASTFSLAVHSSFCSQAASYDPACNLPFVCPGLSGYCCRCRLPSRPRKPSHGGSTLATLITPFSAASRSNLPSSRFGFCHESLMTKVLFESSPSSCPFQQVVAWPARTGLRLITASMTIRSVLPCLWISMYRLPSDVLKDESNQS